MTKPQQALTFRGFMGCFDQGESPSAVSMQEGSRRDIPRPTLDLNRHTDTFNGTAGLNEVTLFLLLNEGDFFDLADEDA